MFLFIDWDWWQVLVITKEGERYWLFSESPGRLYERRKRGGLMTETKFYSVEDLKGCLQSFMIDFPNRELISEKELLGYLIICERRC